MEILIVGAVVVALMIFVSTKIKKSVAAAYEPETIENQYFRLDKPQGFLSPLDDDSKFAFEAYTKEFGQNDAEEFRQAQAHLLIFNDASLERVIESIKKEAGEILTEKMSETGSGKSYFIESEKIERSVPVNDFYKIIASNEHRKIYQLKISVLKAYRDNYASRITEMLESFVVK